MEVMRREPEKTERKWRKFKRKAEGGREETEKREGNSGSCGLPVTDSASDNAFIMGKGEQRKGLIHRRVRES